MKRIYVILISIFLLIAGSVSADPRTESIKEAMALREEIHRRIREHLFNGTGNDEEIFKDMEKLFEDVMSDMNDMNNMNSFGSLGNIKPTTFDMAWTESKDGRTLLISPRTKGQHLEINVEKDMITIKGKSESKNSVANFNHSYSVPGDCDASKVKMMDKDGKILMSFPYKVTTKIHTLPKKEIKKEDERKPIPPSDSDVTI